MSIKEFAKKFIKAEDEAWQNGNFDPLEALENPNVIYHILALNQETSGWEAHKQYILTARQGFSNLEQEERFDAFSRNDRLYFFARRTHRMRRLEHGCAATGGQSRLSRRHDGYGGYGRSTGLDSAGSFP